MDSQPNEKMREKRKRIQIILEAAAGCLWIALLLTGCNFPSQSEMGTPGGKGQLETKAAATLTMIVPTNPIGLATLTNTPGPTRQIPTPTRTPTIPANPSPTPTNNVQGKVCFPGESIPSMTAYFEETKTKAVVELPIAEGQDAYKVRLVPGTYLAYAWLNDFSRGGLYSKAVPCGMKAGCKDHTPLPFTVNPGEQLQGIDLCDWYAGPFNVPYPPGKDRGKLTGSISGQLTYPEGGIPTLHVVAFNVMTNNWYYVETNPGWAAYTIPDLPPGVYRIVAYDEAGRAGGHADEGHHLLDVVVVAGAKTDGADITDWSAPEGTFPSDPTR